MENNNNLSVNNDLYDEELDLTKIIKILFKKKYFILFISFLFLIFGYILFKSKKPVWEGQFDIVLKNNSSSNKNINPLQSINSSILNQFISNKAIDLRTEVQILKSQSILMPIFDFVKDEKNKSGIKADSWNFNDWKKSLNIQLERGTSVLNIKYADSDRKLIKPVLEKISFAYKEYSGKDRDEGLVKGINYLDEQKDKISQESKKAYLKFQDFSIKNNLGNFDGLLPFNKTTGIGINNNQLRLNNDQIRKNIESNDIFAAQTSRFRPNFEALYRLETLLVKKSSVLKPKSKQIINLKNQINQLKKSLARPSQTILEYRDLGRDVLRKEELLINIEGQLTKLKLDLARQEDPWELISEPNVDNVPISPKKIKTLFFSTVIGFLLSSLFVLVKYKNDDIIDEPKIFKNLIPYRFIKTFERKEKNNWQYSFELIKNFIVENDEEDKLGILYLNKSDSDDRQYLNNLLERIFTKDKIIVSNLLLDFKVCSKVLIITEPNIISKNSLNYLLEDIKIFNKKISGWIYID